jgi:hypothetical protein
MNDAYTRNQLIDVAQQLGLDNTIIVTVIEEIKKRRRELTANHKLTEGELRKAFERSSPFFTQELADSILENIRSNRGCNG